MINFKRTDSGDGDFQKLVDELNAELRIRDGEDYSFYAQFNKIDLIKQVVVAYIENEPVGCGSVKAYGEEAMEVKRMYVIPSRRGKGTGAAILKELEAWCKEMGYGKCVLETGYNQPEAIGLYKKSGYLVIPNYGQYQGVENSVCFEKMI